MARRGPLGEHVDDHQQPFVERLAQSGRVRTAGSAEELSVLLDDAIRSPRAVAGFENGSSVEASIRRFEAEVDWLMRPRNRRRARRR